ncbi:C40 family peptidase [Alteribacter natronophilus]|uniref:C40 family peptidase n=1 Tax=Alteribacter natronophilus TaxID=2583810 RepID=UPI00110DEBE8|nr:C40 family peptidase [Alteribacter natronophilus]TMW71868.1 NlpC/P60 family protein [Alteribacter natronophilus]
MKRIMLLLLVLLLPVLSNPYIPQTHAAEVTENNGSLSESIPVFWPDPTEQTTFSAITDKLIGTPAGSKRGRTPSEGFSSGGLVQYLYKEHSGILLSRKPVLQRELGKPVTDLQEGDLVFFKGNLGLVSGVYLHGGTFVTVTRDGVSIRNLETDPYWQERFLESRRLTEEERERLNPAFYKGTDHPAVKEALSLLHRPYRLTGSQLSAFDCSYLVQHSFAEMNIFLPRMTYQQFEKGESIPLPDAREGDVLYFSGTWQKGISHTGIYLGDRFFIHASGEEGETTISYLGDSWMHHFTGVRRFDDLSADMEIEPVREAIGLLGTEYRKKGKSPRKGFSRSGLIRYVFKQSGISVPRSAKKQASRGTRVKKGDEQPGDVFFYRTSKGSLFPALYIGNDTVIVVRTDEGVSAADLTFSPYWNYSRVYKIRRYGTSAD